MKKQNNEITILPFLCNNPDEFENFLKSEYNMFAVYGRNWSVKVHEEIVSDQGVYVSASLLNVKSDMLIPVREAKFYEVDSAICELHFCSDYGDEKEKFMKDHCKYVEDQMKIIMKSTKEIILNSERKHLKKYTKIISRDFLQFIECGEINILLSKKSSCSDGDIDELIINNNGNYRYSPRFGVIKEYSLLRIWRPVYGLL